MPPRDSTSSRKKAGRTTGARKQSKSTRCLITSLPADLYPSILHQAIDHDNFILCRALLPYTLSELYRVVEISDAFRLVPFAASIMRRPWLAGEVRELLLRDDSPLDEDTGEVYWETTGLLLGFGQVEALEERRRRPYRARLVLGIGLVKDLLRLFTRLESINVVGMYFIRPILQREPLQDRAWPRLSTIVLNMDEFDDGFADSYDAELVHNLSFLPALAHLIIRFASHDLPVDLLNLGPRVSVPARSLRLKSLTVEKHAHIGCEIRVLLAAPTDSLRTVKIDGGFAYPNLFQDLALLPPSVDHLDLKLGHSCPYNDRTAKHPKLADIAWYLPNLEHLHLAGDIVNKATFDVIYALPRLRCLSLDQHTSIDAARLLSLLRGGPSTWPRIRRLTVSICECPEKGQGLGYAARSKTPNWPPHFGEGDARQLVQICKAKEIELSGSVLCAAGECDSEDEHDCPGWGKEKSTRRKKKLVDGK